MYQENFGRKKQIQFNSESEYYQALGYLAKSDGTTSIHWENNELQGAWGSEGRIHFLEENPTIAGSFSLTAGRPGVKYRTNCNDFIKNIVENHNFIMGSNQELEQIESTIPDDFKDDFNNGLSS